MNWKRFFVVVFALLVALSIGSTRLAAQTSSTGDVAGVVTDPSNAVVPDAKVNLKDNTKGNTQDSKTNKDGAYRFYLLPPGSYTITVSASGFSAQSRQVNVSLGQITNINFELGLGTATQTIVVTEAAPLLQTENGNVATTLSQRQVQELPNPGNDLSYVAQTAPGVVMNTQAGYGNFSANGMPGNSNLFTINGMDDNDPYLNLNNSGSTNLLLGQNEVQEATVVSNGYSGQYGTLAGASINYITRSGGNDFHGRAIYYWNGSAMNAESYLSKAGGNPKPFSNANQWGGDMGGAIKKDKLFWYVNTEGLRVILPSSLDVLTPTSAFESQVISNLQDAGLAASIPFYCTNALAAPGLPAACATVAPVAVNLPGQPVKSSGVGMFNLFNASPGLANAKNIASPGIFPTDNADGSVQGHFTGPGCSTYPGLGTTGSFLLFDVNGNAQPIPATPAAAFALAPCALQYHANPTNFTYEWLLSGRVDYNWGSRDRIFMRVQSDRGDQATFTDPINSVFNAHSFQPEYQGQLVETHTFNASTVNQFILSTAWYSAIFQNGDRAASLAAYPTTLLMNDGSLGTIQTGLGTGGENFAFPQGRNVTQFQISDDVSKTIGNHALKIGMKFRRYDVTDHGFFSRQMGLLIPFTLDDFAWGGVGQDGDPFVFGGATQLQQRFTTATEQPLAYYTIAGYLEDGFRVRPNLTITGSLRVEHQSNLICRHLCFSETAPWFNLALDPKGLTPYNQSIATGLEQFLPGFTNIQWEPRVSFAWQPFGSSHNLVVRGGIGIFYDGFQGSLANTFATNPPNSVRFNRNASLLSPTETSGVNAFAALGIFNQSFAQGFVTGLNEKTIAANIAAATGISFRAPTAASTDGFTNAPQYQKWSLEVQQGIGRNSTISVQYAGNHGLHLLQQNAGVNGFVPGGFADLPGSKPDARFTAVNVLQSSGVSNYNGLIVTFKHQFSGGIVNFNYAWSKAMDESEGLDPFNFNTNTSIRTQEDPLNLHRNYGPADWNVKHYISANYVWELPIRRALMGHGWKPLVEGWQVSGTVFFRTGLPYTVIDSFAPPVQSSAFSYGSTVFATYNGTSVGQAYRNCGGPAAAEPNVSTCLNGALFSPAGSETAFGNLGRNAFVGPHFFDTDFTIMKKTKVPGWERGELGIGFQMFNVFNHANFDQPVGDVNSGSFGKTVAQVASPTSILGSFLGGDNSPRLIQLKMQFTF